MKKLVAIMFLFLICLTTIQGRLSLCDMGYELLADTEEADSENKESKKEIKEFTVTTQKPDSGPGITYLYSLQRSCISPQPVVDQQTPPPDFTC